LKEDEWGRKTQIILTLIGREFSAMVWLNPSFVDVVSKMLTKVFCIRRLGDHCMMGRKKESAVFTFAAS
jgi:hypothetical protein